MSVLINFPTYLSTGGGLDTSDATAEPNKILAGYTAYVRGIKIEGNIPSIDGYTITPGTVRQEVPSQNYLTGNITIRGDAELISDNIRGGISIFDVEGNPNVVNTSSNGAPAASSNNMEAGRVAFVDGQQVTGRAQVLPGSNGNPYIITPTAADQKIATQSQTKFIKYGLTVKGDENLVAGNIKKGIEIFGITGTYSGATFNTQDVIKCSNMTEIAEAQIAYGSTIMSKDAEEKYSPIAVNDWQKASLYKNNESTDGDGYVCVSLGQNQIDEPNHSLYFLTPITSNGGNVYIKENHKVSTWSTPIVFIGLINKCDVNEIEQHILAEDFVLTEELELTKYGNLKDNILELNKTLPAGDYYVYMELKSNGNGNECKFIDFSFVFI